MQVYLTRFLQNADAAFFGVRAEPKDLWDAIAIMFDHVFLVHNILLFALVGASQTYTLFNVIYNTHLLA